MVSRETIKLKPNDELDMDDYTDEGEVYVNITEAVGDWQSPFFLPNFVEDLEIEVDLYTIVSVTEDGKPIRKLPDGLFMVGDEDDIKELPVELRKRVHSLNTQIDVLRRKISEFEKVESIINTEMLR